MKFWWKVLGVIAGLALFIWCVQGVGFEEVWRSVQRLGVYAPVVLLPYFLVYVVDCIGWIQTLPPNSIRFRTLLRVRWSGEAVNSVVPTVYVGGEAVKVWLLRSLGITATEGTQAAIVSKTAQTVAQVGFVLSASAVLLTMAQERAGLKTGVLFVVVSGFAALFALFLVQKVGVFRMALAVLGLFPRPLHVLERRRGKLLEVDQAIVGFYREHPGKFYASTVFYLCGWLLDTLEIYLVAWLLGFPITWPQAFVLEASTGVAKALGMWIPGSLGVQESGIVMISRILGLSETLAVAYAVIRRVRELIFAAVGLGMLYSGPLLRRGAEADPVS